MSGFQQLIPSVPFVKGNLGGAVPAAPRKNTTIKPSKKSLDTAPQDLKFGPIKVKIFDLSDKEQREEYEKVLNKVDAAEWQFAAKTSVQYSPESKTWLALLHWREVIWPNKALDKEARNNGAV